MSDQNLEEQQRQYEETYFDEEKGIVVSEEFKELIKE